MSNNEEKIYVKPQIHEKIDQLIQQGRKYFGSSGASLTHELSISDRKSNFPLNVVKKGLEGERKTTELIKKWMENKENVVLVDSVHLGRKGKNGSLDDNGADTDHVLIIGKSIVIIDTKVWKKYAKYTINNNTIKRNGRNFKGGKVNTTAALHLWKYFFPEADKIYSYICIQQEKTFVSYDKQWKQAPYKLLTAENLEEFLDYAYNKLGKNAETGLLIPIDTLMVTKVVVCAVKPLNLIKAILNRTDI